MYDKMYHWKLTTTVVNLNLQNTINIQRLEIKKPYNKYTTGHRHITTQRATYFILNPVFQYTK